MILLVTLALAAAEPPATTGTVQVGRGNEPAVHLVRKAPAAPLLLAGELVRELRNLPGATVEVVGPAERGSVLVQGYRILALSGGARPLAVGVVVPVGALGLGLSSDAGPPTPLSASPKIRESMQGLVGSKLWIVGQKLLSGEIKVARYGIVLEAPHPARASR